MNSSWFNKSILWNHFAKTLILLFESACTKSTSQHEIWLFIRVSKVVAHHKTLLTQWRYLLMSRFHANIFLITTTYFELRTVLSSLQKSEFLKLIILFFHYFWQQNWNQWHKLSGKTPICFFSTFGSKINEFEWKKSEKNKKNSKNLNVAGNYPNI